MAHGGSSTSTLEESAENLRQKYQDYRLGHHDKPQVSLLLGELDVLHGALQQTAQLGTITGTPTPRLVAVEKVLRYLDGPTDFDNALSSARKCSLLLKQLNVATALCALAHGYSPAGYLDVQHRDLDSCISRLAHVYRRYRDLHALESRVAAASSDNEAESLESESKILLKHLIKALGLSSHRMTTLSISELQSKVREQYQNSVSCMETSTPSQEDESHHRYVT